LVNQDRAAGRGPSPGHPFDLQGQVIAVDSALKPEREDQAQILASCQS
jgi:hypothetical protein